MVVKMQEGCTALMFASHGGHLSVVELLLKHNAQVDVQNMVSVVYRLASLSIFTHALNFICFCSSSGRR